jgi:nitrogenase molybdenum-cofactor synthesis protein NifE
MIYKMGFTTDLSENDIIFGGEKKLYKAIHAVKERYNPAAVFVYLTCVTALIGDDLEAVCQAASEKFDIPVVPVSSPGFVGSKNLGNRVGGEALLEYVIGTQEPAYTTPYDINLIGEYNIAGEMWAVLPLLEKLGIRVLAKITGDARYHEVACAHRAKLNVMICSKAMINVATSLERRYGIPYIEASIYGVEDMNHLLRAIAMPTGRCRAASTGRSPDRHRNGPVRPGSGPLSSTSAGQAYCALYRRRQKLVDRLCGKRPGH